MSRVFNKKNLAISLIIAVLVWMIAAIPSFAIQENKTYTWANGQQQPDIPQTITVGDKTLNLESKTEPKQADRNTTQTETFEKKVESTCTENQLDNLANTIAKTFKINENGYSGDIPRTGINYTPIYKTESVHKEETINFVTQTDNKDDIDKTYVISGHTYNLKDVSFEISRTDSQGNPLTYNATAIYETDIESEKLDHYDVVANYKGTLNKTVNNGDWSITATYSAPDEAPAQQENQNNEQPQQQQQQQNTRPDGPGVSATFNNDTEIGFGVTEPTGENTEEQPADDFGDGGNDSDVPTTTGIREGETRELEGGNTTLDSSRLDSSSMSSADDNESNSNTLMNSILDKKVFGIPVIVPAALALLAGLGLLGWFLGRKNKSAGVVDSAVAETSAYTAFATGEPLAQLIEVKDTPVVDDSEENGSEEEYDQEPLANLELYGAEDSSVPLIVRFPSMEDEDGNRMKFELSDDSQYWIAIEPDVVEHFEENGILAVSSEGNVIYRSDQSESQIKLDEQTLLNALNNEEDNIENVEDDIVKYEENNGLKLIATEVDNIEDGINDNVDENIILDEGEDVFGDVDNDELNSSGMLADLDELESNIEEPSDGDFLSENIEDNDIIDNTDFDLLETTDEENAFEVQKDQFIPDDEDVYVDFDSDVMDSEDSDVDLINSDDFDTDFDTDISNIDEDTKSINDLEKMFEDLEDEPDDFDDIDFS